MKKTKSAIVDSTLDVKEIEGAVASEEEVATQDPENASEIIEKNKGKKENPKK